MKKDVAVLFFVLFSVFAAYNSYKGANYGRRETVY